MVDEFGGRLRFETHSEGVHRQHRSTYLPQIWTCRTNAPHSGSNLWVQESVNKKEFELDKVPTEFNVSDILTKAVGSDVMDKHLRKVGFFNFQLSRT